MAYPMERTTCGPIRWWFNSDPCPCVFIGKEGTNSPETHKASRRGCGLTSSLRLQEVLAPAKKASSRRLCVPPARAWSNRRRRPFCLEPQNGVCACVDFVGIPCLVPRVPTNHRRLFVPVKDRPIVARHLWVCFKIRPPPSPPQYAGQFFWLLF